MGRLYFLQEIKMKRTNFWAMIVALLGISLGACDTGSGAGSLLPPLYFPAPASIAAMDITDAASLFIAPSSSVPPSLAAGDSGQNRLFKVTDDGYVEEVSYLDEEGNEITNSAIPNVIYNIKDYVIVCFDSFYTGAIFYHGPAGYLVRKTDGAVFSLDNVGLPDADGQFDHYKNARVVQQDSQGNIYYSADYGRVIIKINVSDPDNLTKTDFAAIPGNTRYGYDIAPAGHAIYCYQSSGLIAQASRYW
jgi:hypothetical protein